MTSTKEDGIYSLAGKNLKLTSEEDIEPYLQEIRAIENLKELHLGGNTLGVGACQALGKLLSETTKSTLQIADFADIFTGRLISEIPDALRALCDALVEHEALIEMNLSDNAFGGRSAEPMVNFLTHNHHFSVLKLNNNGLGVTGGQIVANALLAAAEELDKEGKESKLRTVICGRNRLEDGSAPYWAKAYAAHKNLEEVRMFQNGIRMDGIVALAQGLASCRNLKVLDFQDNTATVPGSRGIAAALPSWPKLEVLNLSDCLLKPRGGYLVLDALHKGNNVNLHTLQLQYCDLDRQALERLGSALESGALKTVSKLEINGNGADEDDECIENIKRALEKNGHEDALDELDEMDPEGEDEDAEDDEAGVEEEHDDDDDKGVESKTNAAEVAAAAVAAPAASLAVAAGATTAAASGVGEKLDEKLENLNLGADEAAAQDNTASQTGNAARDIEATTEEPSKEEKADVSMNAADGSQATAVVAAADPEEQGTHAAAGKEASVVSSDEANKAHKDDEFESLATATGGAAAMVGAGAMVAAKDEAEPKADMKIESAPESSSFKATTETDKNAAVTAAEVADSAIAVPEEKEAAENAAEVAESAQAVPDLKQAAETADEVDEVAKQVPEHAVDAQPAEQPVVATTSKPAVPLSSAQAPATARHLKQQGSVDLSGELYGDENQARSPRVQTQSLAADTSAATATSAQPPSETQPLPGQQKKRGFRAAIGAIRELLR